MAGVGEHYYELHAGRRGHAAADEAMLRAVTFIRKLGERAHFSQDEQGTRIILERVTQNQHAMDCAVGRLRAAGWSIRFRAILAEDFQPLPGHLSDLASQDFESPDSAYKLAAMFMAAYSIVYDTALQWKSRVPVCMKKSGLSKS